MNIGISAGRGVSGVVVATLIAGCAMQEKQTMQSLSQRCPWRSPSFPRLLILLASVH
jgi:hypothetical protein